MEEFLRDSGVSKLSNKDLRNFVIKKMKSLYKKGFIDKVKWDSVLSDTETDTVSDKEEHGDKDARGVIHTMLNPVRDTMKQIGFPFIQGLK